MFHRKTHGPLKKKLNDTDSSVEEEDWYFTFGCSWVVAKHLIQFYFIYKEQSGQDGWNLETIVFSRLEDNGTKHIKTIFFRNSFPKPQPYWKFVDCLKAQPGKNHPLVLRFALYRESVFG